MNPCHEQSLSPLPCIRFRGFQGGGVHVPVGVHVHVPVKVKVKVKSRVPVGVSAIVKVFPRVMVLPFVKGSS